MENSAKTSISIIIPTLNEEDNIKLLIERINKALTVSDIAYQLIFIDDHSTDRTVERIEALRSSYPVECHLKQGKRGKAFSILEGVQYTHYDYTGFIDADLQYPPEVIPEMIVKLNFGHDVVVTKREEKEVSWFRKLQSKIFNLIFVEWLHKLKIDTQSGLKVFKTKVLREVHIDPTPWTFDLEFLLQARTLGYEIGEVPITFSEREHGESKISFFQSVVEIGWNAVKIKFRQKKPILIKPRDERNMKDAGIARNGKRFITHTTLDKEYSAFDTFVPWQVIVGILFLGSFGFGLIIEPIISAIIFLGVLNLLYFIDSIFNLVLVFRSMRQNVMIEHSENELIDLRDSDLPVYTIFCPLYKEANVLEEFLRNINRLKWPKEKLDVLLLLEEDDDETINKAKKLEQYSFVRTIIVPHSKPKTKPKACNYGLAFARGEYAVIYDAEDKPDPWQLKKAYLGFQKSPSNIRCLQAKLNYYNSKQNLLTKLFTAEYSLWFDVILPGLQSINTSIPLGGTSNHFKTKDLIKLKGWDPFNVTEDCDLGVRLFKRGYRTAIIDSVTWEEANSRVKNWIRQRSRWIKGYMQTFLVHMRSPFKFIQKSGVHAFIFQLTVGGKVAFMIINPILWITTLSYFTFRPYVGETIESLFPPVIFYISAFSLIFGNFLYIYYYMIGCSRRGHWELLKYVFLIPFYWILVSVAALVAAYQLFFKPHYWEKTQHGLHLAKPEIAKPTESIAHGKVIIQESRSTIRAYQLEPISVPVRNMTWVTPSYSVAKTEKINLLKSSVEKEFKQIKKQEKQIEKEISKKFFIEKKTWLNIAKELMIKNIKRISLKGELVFVAGLMIANVINFVFHAYISRTLSYTNLGLVAFINTLWYITMMFVNPLSSAVNQKTSFLTGKKDTPASTKYYRSITLKSLRFISYFSLFWIIATPFLTNFFNLDSLIILLIITPIFSFGVLYACYRGYLMGLFKFSQASMIFLVEAISKILFAILLVNLNLHDWVYLSIPLSVFAGALVGFIVINQNIDKTIKPAKITFPKKFYSASLMTNISSMIFLSIDMIVVAHFLPPIEVGKYAVLSIVGKMIFFLTSTPSLFFMSFVNRNEGKNIESDKLYKNIYLSTLLLVVPCVLAFGFLGKYFIPMLLGPNANAVLVYLLPYTLAISIFTIANLITQYHLARRDYLFSYFALLSSLMLVIGISLFHDTISHIVTVILVVSTISWAMIEGLHYLNEHNKLFKRAVKDLSDVFSKPLAEEISDNKSGRRILVFNWRDIRHKYAGGAEIYLHEILKRWTEKGIKVTLFCGNDGVSPRQETADGVEIIRRGGFYLVYIWAFLYYIFRFRNKYDVIIDCQNGIPFFTPFYTRKPVYCLMFHVHQEVFRKSLNKFLAVIAVFLERDLMPVVYNRAKFVTISESSKEAIQGLDLGKSGIEIVYPGVDLKKCFPGQKNEEPLVVYLGRLKYYKSVHLLITAFKNILERIPNAKLAIIGSGEEEKALREQAKKEDLENSIIFTGQVTEFEKLIYLQKAWVAVNPSYMEGWGLTTIEANACGTPVVASNVPGLRDSVLDNHTGFLVDYGKVEQLSEKIIFLLNKQETLESMSSTALNWAHNFSWENSSQTFLNLINFDSQINNKINIFNTIWKKLIPKSRRQES